MYLYFIFFFNRPLTRCGCMTMRIYTAYTLYCPLPFMFTVKYCCTKIRDNVNYNNKFHRRYYQGITCTGTDFMRRRSQEQNKTYTWICIRYIIYPGQPPLSVKKTGHIFLKIFLI